MNEQLTITLIKQFHETNQNLLKAITETNKHVAEINAAMSEHFGIHSTKIEQHDEEIEEIEEMKENISALKKRVESAEQDLERMKIKNNMIVKFICFFMGGFKRFMQLFFKYNKIIFYKIMLNFTYFIYFFMIL